MRAGFLSRFQVRPWCLSKALIYCSISAQDFGLGFTKTQELHAEARLGMKQAHLNLLKLNITSISWEQSPGGCSGVCQACDGSRPGPEDCARAQMILRDQPPWPRWLQSTPMTSVPQNSSE